VIQFGPKIE